MAIKKIAFQSIYTILVIISLITQQLALVPVSAAPRAPISRAKTPPYITQNNLQNNKNLPKNNSQKSTQPHVTTSLTNTIISTNTTTATDKATPTAILTRLVSNTITPTHTPVLYVAAATRATATTTTTSTPMPYHATITLPKVFVVTSPVAATTAQRNRGLAGVMANTAPVATDSTLTNIAEDVTLATNTGNTIASLTTGTDVDSGALGGIAVTAVDNSHGMWEYSTNGGTTWTGFWGISSTTARLLSANNTNHKIRFRPDVDYTGTATITYRAWDQTTGTGWKAPEIDLGDGRTLSPFPVPPMTPPAKSKFLSEQIYSIHVRAALTNTRPPPRTAAGTGISSIEPSPVKGL